MIVYLIQHEKTGSYLPTTFSRKGMQWEGEAGKMPRLFLERRAAQRFLTRWQTNTRRGRIREAEIVVYPEWAESGSLTRAFRSKRRSR